jgi:hypothetical protein
VQKFIDLYSARHTRTPARTKGIADIIGCCDAILGLNENNEEEARRAAMFLICATTMWRQTSVAHTLLQPIDPNDKEWVILALPSLKMDKGLNGRKIKIPPASETRLSPAFWISNYIQLSSAHRTSQQMEYLFIPLANAKDGNQKRLTVDTISNQIKKIISASGLQTDETGNPVTPSSLRKSSQHRARRAGADEDTINFIGNWKATIRAQHYDNYVVPRCWTDITLALSDTFIPQEPLPLHPSLGTSMNNSISPSGQIERRSSEEV